MTDKIPFRVQPMLATPIRRPFHKAGWVYEEKYDGFRVGVTYLAPKLVAQIAYDELMADQKLRQPVFLGLRDDNGPDACFLPGETG
jgi:ATP-dependent DNA ligase